MNLATNTETTRLPTITFDVDRCKKCGLCTQACTRAVLHQNGKKTLPEIDGLERCYSCGSCVSVCPRTAISHSNFPDGAVNQVNSENLPNYDQVLELIRARRSHRLFKSQPVEREVLEQVLEAARFAPSGHNEQSTEFIVIQDQKTIRKLAEVTAAYIGNLAANFKNPIGRMIMRYVLGRRGAEYVSKMSPELEHIANLFKEGTDWVLREPPVLLLFCADSAAGNFMSVNANLALQNATLAGETLGLGSYYTGFLLLAADREKKINEIVGLPETHKVFGALALGYPTLKYKRWPERNPAKVNWI